MICRELGDKRSIAASLESFASLAAAEAKSEIENRKSKIKRAAFLWGAAERRREEIGAPKPPNDREEIDRQVASAKETLGEAAFAAAWAEGQAMTWEQAIEYALEDEVVGWSDDGPLRRAACP